MSIEIIEELEALFEKLPACYAETLLEAVRSSPHLDRIRKGCLESALQCVINERFDVGALSRDDAHDLVCRLANHHGKKGGMAPGHWIQHSAGSKVCVIDYAKPEGA